MPNTIAIEREIVEFKRQKLGERLSRLTQEQVAFFWRIFPRDKFPDGVPDNKLIDAIDLCDRTIRKNMSGRNGPGWDDAGELARDGTVG